MEVREERYGGAGRNSPRHVYDIEKNGIHIYHHKL